MRPYPTPGETVGPYQLERRLGEGQQSTVYAATQVRSRQRVALKVISDDTDTAERRRITLAARGHASVGSPHVTRVHLYGEHDARMFVASDLITDGTLDLVLRRQGGAPVLAGLDLMAQVATGLEAVHARGLVHGALTPGNVLLQWRAGRMCAVLADVGMSRHDTAPEVLQGAARSAASDIHSLGVLTWTTLVGRPPFAGTSYQVAESYVRDRLPLLAGTSPRVARLNAVLARATHPDPAARHVAPGELRADLLEAMALPGEPGPLDTLPPASHGPDRRTTMVTVWVLLAVMLTGLVASGVLLALDAAS